MFKANEAWNLSQTKKISDTSMLMLKCEQEILTACKMGYMWCLVPTCAYNIGAKINVLRELIHTYGYSVTQRNNEQGNCLYIKWGHANVTVSEDKEAD